MFGSKWLLPILDSSFLLKRMCISKEIACKPPCNWVLALWVHYFRSTQPHFYVSALVNFAKLRQFKRSNRLFNYYAKELIKSCTIATVCDPKEMRSFKMRSCCCADPKGSTIFSPASLVMPFCAKKAKTDIYHFSLQVWWR